MVVHGVLTSQAWQAEVEHLSALLLGMIDNSFVAETIYSLVYHRRESIHHVAQLWAILDWSDAFWGASGGRDDLHFGSIARLSVSSMLGRCYRDLALDLLRMTHLHISNQ